MSCHIFHKFILLCMLVSSFVLVSEELGEATLGLHCVERVETDPAIAEKLRNDPLSIDLIGLFNKHTKDLSDSQFLDLVKLALKHNPDLAECAIDEHGNRLIHLAACKGSLELLELLLEQYHIDASMQNGWSMIPLEISNICDFQAAELIKKELLRENENFKEEVSNFENTLSIDQLPAIACVESFENQESTGKLLRMGTTTLNILELLGAFGYTIPDRQLEAWIRREIEKNPDISRCAVDEYGNTLVHITSCREMVPLTEMLLAEYKADVNALNAWGLTPIDMALMCSAQEQALLEKVLNSLLDQQEQLTMPDLDAQRNATTQAEIEEKDRRDVSPQDTLHDEL